MEFAEWQGHNNIIDKLFGFRLNDKCSTIPNLEGTQPKSSAKGTNMTPQIDINIDIHVYYSNKILFSTLSYQGSMVKAQMIFPDQNINPRMGPDWLVTRIRGKH